MDRPLMLSFEDHHLPQRIKRLPSGNYQALAILAYRAVGCFYPGVTDLGCTTAMNLTTPELRNLAIRLLSDGTGEDEVVFFTAAARFCVRLSTVLSKLTGPAGSRSLLSRAMVLARQEAPCLAIVQVMPDGRLQGFEDIIPDQEQEEWNNAGVVLVTQLLGLLHAFIGQQLTMQLVDEAWHIAPVRTQDHLIEHKP